jgi:hypothetical protein
MSGQQQVDVSYQGLSVGEGLVMRDFGPTTAQVELADPMPVGTELAVAVPDGVGFSARVVRVQEKTEGVDVGFMRVAVSELPDDVKAWWDALVTAEDPVDAPPPDTEVVSEPGLAPEAEAAPEVAAYAETDAVPAPVADAPRTQMMSAVSVAEIEAMAAGQSPEEFAEREAEAAEVGVSGEPAAAENADDDRKKKRRRKRKKR